LKKLLLILSIFASLLSNATHNRAGEILYKHKGGYTYEITIITYTYTPSEANAQRNALPVIMGDGRTINFPRVSIEILPDDYQKNTYVYTYTYPGPGSYKIVMEDPNRNLGIVNIDDSVNIPFSISTRINIDPILGDNSTPNLLNPPIDKAAIGQIFIHNPSAYDLNGDSLSYKLTSCTGQNGLPIEDFKFPDTEENFYINEVTGDLIWDAPKVEGNYNVAIIIEEWRNGVKIGQITRDLQIDVYKTENNPPKIDEIPDVCAHPGDSIIIPTYANDEDGDTIYFSATGGPFLAEPPAYFKNNQGVSPLENTFSWGIKCNHVQQQPYQVVIKATDKGEDVPLVDMEYFNITVIGHPPELQNINTTFNSTHIYWKNTICSNAKFIHIYRSRSPQTINQDECSRGMPSGNNYTHIATVSNDSTQFIDNNRGKYLSQGFTYCYRLVAEYPDGSLSYVSNEICSELKKGLPFFTEASVLETDTIEGSINITWHTPTLTDSLGISGPYKYKLERHSSKNPDRITIKENISLHDTTFTDESLNTSNNQFFYSLSLYGTQDGSPKFIGETQATSSVYLTPLSRDKSVEISAYYATPWENIYADIYRRNDSEWTLIAKTPLPFLDTGLINNNEYCYYITTHGIYPENLFKDSLINNSQQACALPQDTLAPAAPTMHVEQNCANTSYTITWENKEIIDSVEYFNIYYKDCKNTEYILLKTVDGKTNSFPHSFIDSTKTMTACYYITAVDDNGNESEPSNDTCMNGCPLYSLPNTFTPNDDEKNEVFSSFPYRFVEKVDFKVYNSWGEYIWETDDPNINWPGITNKDQAVTNGVYYYTCDVYEYWLSCKYEPRTLLGFIHIIGADGVTDPSKTKK